MNEFEHQPVVGVDAGPMKEEETGKGVTCNKLVLGVEWVTGFQFESCVSFLGGSLNCYMTVSIMISLQSNITQNLEQFKSCNRRCGCWLESYCRLFMYLFCLYQSVGMCIWWTSSLGYVEKCSNLNCARLHARVLL